jgi:bifunctional non-homologous end joining protein LigD
MIAADGRAPRLPAQARSRADPEPFGGDGSSGAPVFVIQRHDARRLHYDLRLERDGALASWAVPKGLPLEAGSDILRSRRGPPARLRLVRGRDTRRPVRRGNGGDLGPGDVRAARGEANGGLTVHLHGERVDGIWTLVPARLDGDERNWLLLRKDAAEAAPGPELRPQLATLTEHLPTGAGWLYEPKWDGYRALVALRG